MKININFNLYLSEQDIDGIVTTAFEGGINYWCDKAIPIGKDKRIGSKCEYLGEFASDNISKGGNIVLFDSESEDIYGKPKKYLLTPTKFKKAISKLVSLSKLPIYTSHNKYFLDVGNIDADLADMIIQVAVFGDVIYG